MKRVFIGNIAGLGNRLEALMLARALQIAYGGEIRLNWQELDALQIPFARRGGQPLLDRWRSCKVRNCDDALFAELRAAQYINLRVLYGPRKWVQPIYLETAAAFKVRADLVSAINEIFYAQNNRPVAGVHIRRGDYVSYGADYDTVRTKHPALPIEWVEAAMQRCLRFWPDCVFFVAASGDESDCVRLRKNFDIFQLPPDNPYEFANPGHAAGAHPVADLFALACCRVLIASPLSSFSHFAANVLGPATTCIVPPQQLAAGETRLCHLEMRGEPFESWVNAFRQPAELPVLTDELGKILRPEAQWDWIPSFEPR